MWIYSGVHGAPAPSPVSLAENDGHETSCWGPLHPTSVVLEVPNLGAPHPPGYLSQLDIQDGGTADQERSAGQFSKVGFPQY